jgi:hypothetical protein
MSQSIINSLLRERNLYVRRGLAARVKAVDEALANLGYRTPTEDAVLRAQPIETAQAEPELETAVVKPARRSRRGA